MAKIARIGMNEERLAELVIEWLRAQNWEIYQEVEFSRLGGIADIVAVRQGIMWIIETKTAMSIDVLNQASAWPVHFRSVAVPASVSRDNRRRDYRVAKDYYGVGVIEVLAVKSTYKDEEILDIYETVKPPLYLRHHKQAKRMLSQLDELHKTFAKAGSKGHQHLTPYKQTMLAVRRHVEQHPGCTVQDLFDQYGSMHYASKSSFKGNLLKCLEAYEKDWCRVDSSKKPFRLYIKDGAPVREQLPLSHFVGRATNG